MRVRLLAVTGLASVSLFTGTGYAYETVSSSFVNDRGRLDVSADGELVAFGSSRSVTLWRRGASGRRFRAMDEVEFALSGDGRTLVVQRTSSRLEVWDTRTLRRKRTIRGYYLGRNFGAGDMSHDGRFVTAFRPGRYIDTDGVMLNLSTARAALLPGATRKYPEVQPFSMSPNGRWVLYGVRRGNGFGKLWLLNRRTSARKRVRYEKSFVVSGIDQGLDGFIDAIADDGDRFTAGSLFWSVKRGRLGSIPQGLWGLPVGWPNLVFRAHLSRDRRVSAFGCGRDLYTYNNASGEYRRVAAGLSGFVDDAWISGDARSVIVALKRSARGQDRARAKVLRVETTNAEIVEAPAGPSCWVPLPPDDVLIKSAPKVTGSLAVGSTLTCEPGEFWGKPTRVVYQWSRRILVDDETPLFVGDVTPVGTSQTYTAGRLDRNQELTCEAEPVYPDMPDGRRIRSAKSLGVVIPG